MWFPQKDVEYILFIERCNKFKKFKCISNTILIKSWFACSEFQSVHMIIIFLETIVNKEYFEWNISSLKSPCIFIKQNTLYNLIMYILINIGLNLYEGKKKMFVKFVLMDINNTLTI